MKDLCFPNGVEIRTVKTIAELRRTLNPTDLQQTFFSFTLNSMDEMSPED